MTFTTPRPYPLMLPPSVTQNTHMTDRPQICPYIEHRCLSLYRLTLDSLTMHIKMLFQLNKADVQLCSSDLSYNLGHFGEI